MEVKQSFEFQTDSKSGFDTAKTQRVHVGQPTATVASADSKVQNLELSGVVGYNGGVPEGLILHPDDEHILYPLGTTIVVKNLLNNTQTFLRGGHNGEVSCIAISASGKYLASGQESQINFSAPVVVWNLETCEIVRSFAHIKGKVQALVFSPREDHLVAIGGEDDGRVVVYNLEQGASVCSGNALNDHITCVKFFNNKNDTFITGGRNKIRVWQFKPNNRKMQAIECKMGAVKRYICSITIANDDSVCYVGTRTGDILAISLKANVFKRAGPKKLFGNGVSVVAQTNKGNIIVGCGNGTVAVVRKDFSKVVRRLKVKGPVTSLQLNAAGDHFFVGTATCNIYLVQLATFQYELRTTCHSGKIHDLVFAKDYSKLFATCGRNGIRVWQTSTRNELLRITVPNLDCLCIAFRPDGKAILSGWSDGKIRCFRPQSGKLMYVINDAHNGAVTAITSTNDSRHIVSGGTDGQVRLWEANTQMHRMVTSMKEHKQRVNCIQVSKDDSECVSASSDGSCIVWSLRRYTRAKALFAATKFHGVAYHPDESQIITIGTDRKITYWDAVEGTPIRIMDASQSELFALSISPDGEGIVSAGVDEILRVWGYDDGECYFQGEGHSGAITKSKVSPDQRHIVSVGADGGIFIWDMPVIPTASADVTGPSRDSIDDLTNAQQ